MTEARRIARPATGRRRREGWAPSPLTLPALPRRAPPSPLSRNGRGERGTQATFPTPRPSPRRGEREREAPIAAGDGRVRGEGKQQGPVSPSPALGALHAALDPFDALDAVGRVDALGREMDDFD